MKTITVILFSTFLLCGKAFATSQDLEHTRSHALEIAGQIEEHFSGQEIVWEEMEIELLHYYGLSLSKIEAVKEEIIARNLLDETVGGNLTEPSDLQEDRFSHIELAALFETVGGN